MTIQDFVLNQIQLGLPFQKTKVVTPQFKFIDLFAGIGGIRLPFDELGGDCVFGSDIDKFARQTYRAFYGDDLHGDIHDISESSIPDFDILLAGFPCQPFSQAGHKNGFSDTRGTLFFEIERILRSKKPRAFLLENVKGLKGHDGGRTFDVIIKSLEALGYTVHHKILAARSFDLPQNRERIYIVGFLDAKVASRFDFPEAIAQTKNLGNVLENKPDPKYTISDRLWQGHQRRRTAHAEKGNGFGYGLFTHESDYVNTISARYYKDGSEILVAQKGKNPRKLTPTEAARIQGFPDEIVDKARAVGMSDVQLYKQFGNSVAVNVVRHVARNMISALQIQQPMQAKPLDLEAA